MEIPFTKGAGRMDRLRRLVDINYQQYTYCFFKSIIDQLNIELCIEKYL